MPFDPKDIFNMDPELINAIAESGLFDDWLAQHAGQMQRGEQIQQQNPQPQGMTVQPGYIAANPLQHFAAMMERDRGSAMERNANQQIIARLRGEQATRAKVFPYMQRQQQAGFEVQQRIADALAKMGVGGQQRTPWDPQQPQTQIPYMPGGQ